MATLAPIDPKFLASDSPVCLLCAKPATLEESDYLDTFCSVDCHAAHEENENERRHERWLERCYGGDSPQTDHERYLAAHEEKRGLR